MANVNGTSGIDNLVGTALDDIILGLAGRDTLQGLAGNDTLDGGSGADTMSGGLGNDIYVVDNLGDTVTENAGEGIDTVRAKISWTLGANIERLLLLGTAAIDGTGNDLANALTGNAAANTLSGLGGNDLLDGKAGADTLKGGLGDDTYVVDNVGDKVIENAGEGTDTVKASITFTLAANVEKLLLIGTAAIDGTGNDLANALTGNAAANALSGLGGNDLIDGGLGADTMRGGLGDDTFVVDNAGDTVIENLNEGTDTVRASIGYTLAANVEKLLLTGTSAIDGTGNGGNNTLTGNDAANVLSGLAGNDTILAGGGNDRVIGGAGLDIVTGGAGADVFVFAPGDFASRTSIGADEIVDFTSGDKIDVSQIDALVSASGYGQPGDQAFLFISTNKFTNHTGRQLRYEVSGGNTYVYGNMDGDTTADWCIKIDGVHTLASSDFVL
ncbi:calcium-binding protein [Novosphingobium huizhouense]|uniref:calcium-binding protein n=1 Tax=Novosphingobium huizhouense TaxID=2866625 RepID=UPI001CD878A7|nr:calcium-binding protein [Novosphingobium huizhouense]